jgi:hypothetical protein
MSSKALKKAKIRLTKKEKARRKQLGKNIKIAKKSIQSIFERIRENL